MEVASTTRHQQFTPLHQNGIDDDRNDHADDESSVDPATKLKRTVFRVAEVVVSILALFFFFFGVTNNAHLVMQMDGYNEVFTVIGCLFVGPLMYSIYELAAKFCSPRVKPSTEQKMWLFGLKLFTAVGYVAQCAALMVYLVAYLGKSYLGFLIADLIIFGIIVGRSKWTSVWTTLYVLIFVVKIGLFWPTLDEQHGVAARTGTEESNGFISVHNDLGENGFLATLFVTIPIIHFPVLLSRVSSSGSIFEAHVTNMASVFAHILHYLDTLELYFLGIKRSTFSDDVQYLILMFSLMGCVTCNLYFISLFYQDDAVEKTLKRFQPTVVGVFSPEEGVKNEDLLHFFLWMVFFIDLPFAALRGIAWVVHGTELSVFFAKNLMMMASVATLILQHSRR